MRQSASRRPKTAKICLVWRSPRAHSLLKAMLRLSEVKLPLDHPQSVLDSAVLARLAEIGVPPEGMVRYTVFRRAHDARKRADIKLTYILDVELKDEATAFKRMQGKPNFAVTPDMEYHFVAKAPRQLTAQRPVVIGMGPCGLFAGLILAQMGLRPIILERGKAVRERTKDTFGLWRKSVLNPESNVQFGEGGAGTFSDGKLYSQIKDPRQLGRKVLDEFVRAGAPEDILFLSRPHIGTFRLVSMVEKMRATIHSLGGEVRFETKVDEIEIDKGKLRALKLSNGETLHTNHVVLAIGHSARDTFEMLHAQGVYIEAKPFSLGFRIEHPQGLIDRSRYGKFAGHEQLGAADYKVVHHANNGRAVYSFCMCPGGTVVAAASEPGRVVTNGMSQYSRAERNANAGIVVGITPEDFPGGPLAGIEFQRKWETRAFELGGSNYCAPGQLVGDFIAGRPSTSLGSVIPSYKPGVTPTDLSTALPDYVIEAIREALPELDKKIAGFAMHDAVLTGVETRTSSPIRIRRKDNFQSMNVEGLYPAGEGAGYAGGIYSAAIDGIEVAEALALDLLASQEASA
jgi:uncharacterized FAD-dependent dehydrogenase